MDTIIDTYRQKKSKMVYKKTQKTKNSLRSASFENNNSRVSRKSFSLSSRTQHKLKELCTSMTKYYQKNTEKNGKKKSRFLRISRNSKMTSNSS